MTKYLRAIALLAAAVITAQVFYTINYAREQVAEVQGAMSFAPTIPIVHEVVAALPPPLSPIIEPELEPELVLPPALTVPEIDVLPEPAAVKEVEPEPKPKPKPRAPEKKKGPAKAVAPADVDCDSVASCIESYTQTLRPFDPSKKFFEE